MLTASTYIVFIVALIRGTFKSLPKKVKFTLGAMAVLYPLFVTFTLLDEGPDHGNS